ncbi:YobI family P-loop NTPase [Microbacterium halophytorum]
MRSRRPARPGNTIPLKALAPDFQREYHQVYLDLLERALRHPDTRSVALTGSYGSGKSSVLRALGRTWWRRRRIVELSLSTLDPDLIPPAQIQNPAEREKSNQIQKELVKQLLYRLPPGRTPRSRFPRASSPSRGTGLFVAFTAAAAVGAVWVVALLAGWQPDITQRIEGVGWSGPWFWAAAAAVAALGATGAWWVLAGKYALQAGLKAGAVTVSLAPTSSSYFDQYLDEIMYFFQVSKAGIVLIEDVDRFDDAVVFDTLRALNTLLNSSRQVRRRVIFIYAIRDSVLGRIGAEKTTSKGEPSDTAAADTTPVLEIDKANRTKYFDVIIPIVPFVTADNARDLLMEIMQPHLAHNEGAPGISPSLIRLAARHVADMRTLLSIRNEFEVHLDRLMTSARAPMPDINHDIILSLVLLRATSPDAYEKIRLKTSPLDDLNRRWLTLVEENLETLTAELTRLRTQLETGVALDLRLGRAAAALDARRSELFELAQGITPERVQFSGPLSDDNLANLMGWQQIADGQLLTLTFFTKPDRYSQRQTKIVTVGRHLLAQLLDMPIDPASWRTADVDELNDQIASTEAEIRFLRHHTWAEVHSRPDLTVKAAGRETSSRVEGHPAGEAPAAPKAVASTRPNFTDLVQEHAPSELAAGLIAHGYLPRHFARYASTFYGKVVGLNATEFISRAIEPGTPIVEYELNEQDVAQVLAEQQADEDDADLFDDLSIYNLDIVAYLLLHRPRAAQRVADHLAARWGEVERSFLSRFLQRATNDQAAALTSMMAPNWQDALRFTISEVALAPASRYQLVDAVLNAVRSDERDDLDPEVGRFLAANYPQLPTAIAPRNPDRAAIVMTVFEQAGATIADLTPLNDTAITAATALSIYPVTAPNLQAIGGAEEVPLDALRSRAEGPQVYEHVIKRLPDYLDALGKLDPPATPIKDPSQFTAVLNDIATSSGSDWFDEFVSATADACTVPDLESVDPSAWSALVKFRRTDETFENVDRYVNEHELDAALGEFLAERAQITTTAEITQAAKSALAATVLASRDSLPDPSTRVALVKSLEPGVLPVTHVGARDGELVGLLLREGLLADAPDTFSADLLSDWRNLESAIQASQSFAAFADATIMPPRHLAAMLTSSKLSVETRDALAVKLVELLTGATATDGTATANALARQGTQLDFPRIDALRESGADRRTIIQLAATQSEGLSTTELRALLHAMGGECRRLALGGSGVVRFDVDGDHRAVLARLAGITHTGAKEGFTLKHGTKLEANLKHAPAIQQ